MGFWQLADTLSLDDFGVGARQEGLTDFCIILKGNGYDA